MIIWMIRHWYVVGAATATGVFLWLLELLHVPQSLIAAVAVYLLLVGACYWYVYKDSLYQITVGITYSMAILGHTGLYVLFEHAIARYIFGVYVAFLIGAVLYIPTHFSARLAHEYKPWRRMFVSIMTISLFSIVATLYGLEMFFQTTGVLLYGTITSMLAALTAYAIFRLYHPVNTTRMVIWAAIVSLVSFELFVVLAYLSFGYLILAAVFILVWYGMILLIRFHLSSKGIVWKKQIGFLISLTLLLMCIFLFANWL